MEKSYSVNTSDWLRATKDMKVSTYVEYWQEKVEPEHPFTKKDYEEALKKVLHKREP